MSIEVDNVYLSDNLDLMREMEDGFIELIYSDILFNTGRQFADYADNLGTPREAIAWYEPRIIEMRRVLRDTGSIYLHCDTSLSHYLKTLLDDVFGRTNFRNEIVWCYRQGGRSKRTFARKHDTIFFYSKSDRYTFNADAVRVPYEGTGGFQNSGKGTTINGKQYIPHPDGKIPEDWWDIPALTPMSKERVGYDTQKPRALLERVIKASSNEGDVVADLFCGSGTTLVAAKNLARRYVGCDINPRAVDIAIQRLSTEVA